MNAGEKVKICGQDFIVLDEHPGYTAECLHKIIDWIGEGVYPVYFHRTNEDVDGVEITIVSNAPIWGTERIAEVVRFWKLGIQFGGKNASR